MQQNSKKKICIIVDCLSGGGAEKQAANLSISLNAKGFDVSIITLRNEVSYTFKGTLYNLGINESKWKLQKQIRKFFQFKKTYQQINADVYIDFRTRSRFLMEFLFHAFVFEAKKLILTVHNYHIHWHLPKGRIFYRFYNKAKAVTAVAKQIEERLLDTYPFQNVQYLPNFVTKIKEIHAPINTSEIGDYIIAVGRLRNDIKQFDKLITTYKESKLHEKGVKLLIFGDGEDREKLAKLIVSENLSDAVKLMGFTDQLSTYVKNAKYMVLSSRVEGFPMVILEALQLQTPVISFDCTSGPREIIIDKYNGLLVENQNFDDLKDAMILLIENMELYMKCKENTVSSMSKFNEEYVIPQWITLINA